MKGRTFLLLFVLIILMVPISTYIIYNTSKVYDYKKIPMEVEVNEYTGIAVTNESLNFGVVRPGNKARKSISIESTYKVPVIVNIGINGNIKDFIIHEENSILKPNESKELNFTADIPKDSEKGKYVGNATITILSS